MSEHSWQTFHLMYFIYLFIFFSSLHVMNLNIIKYFGCFEHPCLFRFVILPIIMTMFFIVLFKGETFPLSFEVRHTSQLKPCHSPSGSLRRALQRLWRVWRRMWHTWRSWNHLKARSVKRSILYFYVNISMQMFQQTVDCGWVRKTHCFSCRLQRKYQKISRRWKRCCLAPETRSLRLRQWPNWLKSSTTPTSSFLS